MRKSFLNQTSIVLSLIVVVTREIQLIYKNCKYLGFMIRLVIYDMIVIHPKERGAFKRVQSFRISGRVNYENEWYIGGYLLQSRPRNARDFGFYACLSLFATLRWRPLSPASESSSDKSETRREGRRAQRLNNTANRYRVRRNIPR
jgi:hypothetical protein